MKSYMELFKEVRSFRHKVDKENILLIFLHVALAVVIAIVIPFKWMVLAMIALMIEVVVVVLCRVHYLNKEFRRLFEEKND